MTDSSKPYPDETLPPDEDDGTMPSSVEDLRCAVIGHRIIRVERPDTQPGTTTLILDNGQRVRLVDTADCCAFTEIRAFLLHPELVDHMILGVGTTDHYATWHIYADLGDVLELTVNWSCGNPFYYGYGFGITVEDQP